MADMPLNGSCLVEVKESKTEKLDINSEKAGFDPIMINAKT